MRVRFRGFTLIETLVMLIISALVVALMFQALAGFNRARQRVAAIEGVRNNQAVLYGWMRDTIRGVVAVDPASVPGHKSDDVLYGMRGDSHGFMATTLEALDGEPGLPVEVRWKAVSSDGGTELTYEQTGHRPLSFALGNARVSFGYLDETGAVSEQWPPSLGKQQALPQAVQVTVDGVSGRRVLVEALAVPHQLLPDPFQVSSDE